MQFSPSTDIEMEELNDELIFFNPATGGSHHLNGTAALIWRLIEQGHSQDEIINLIAEAYPDADVAADIKTVFEQLLESGLIYQTSEGSDD